MATFTNLQLGYDSVTGTGEPIQVAGTTAGAATTLHTITDGTEAVVTITATNYNTTDEELVIQIGGTTDGDKASVTTIVGASTRVVLNRHPLKASGSNLVIEAFSTTTNQVNVLVEVK